MHIFSLIMGYNQLENSLTLHPVSRKGGRSYMNTGSTFKGFSLGAIAAASYGLNPLFTLPLYSEGLSADSVLCYRYGFAVLLLAIMLKVQKQSFALRRCEILPLVIIGLLFSFSSLTLFESYNYMDAGIASTILFIYPVLVAVIMAVFFKERISVITMTSIALAFWGITMLYHGDSGETLSTVGVLMVFISSLTYAIYIVGVNRSVLKDMPPAKLTFYALLFGWSVYIVRLHFFVNLDLIQNPVHWINPIALALIPTIISLITMTKAIHYIGSTYAAILGALEPITALCIGVAVFDEKMTPRIFTGIVLVLIAVTLIIIGKPLAQFVRQYVSRR